MAGGQGNEYGGRLYEYHSHPLGNGNQGFGTPPEQYSGSAYLSNGTPTGGVNYAYPFSAGALYDGATNGVNNFAIDYITGNVYSFGVDWSNPRPPVHHCRKTIWGSTYDPVNQSLWIAGLRYDRHSRLFSNGNLAFLVHRQRQRLFGLAMDYSDNTLWADNQAPFTSTTGRETS